jgi:3D (Asp-Asp-Asp) domain-containing protein
MNDAKSSEDLYLLNLIYNIYCSFSIRYEIFIKNVAEDSEYIKKITGLDLESLKKVLNVYKSYAPKNIPFGTKIAFNGNTYIVQDRGGAIKNKRLDLYFESHTEALKWGVRKVDVTIMHE